VGRRAFWNAEEYVETGERGAQMERVNLVVVVL